MFGRKSQELKPRDDSEYLEAARTIGETVRLLADNDPDKYDELLNQAITHVAREEALKLEAQRIEAKTETDITTVPALTAVDIPNLESLKSQRAVAGAIGGTSGFLAAFIGITAPIIDISAEHVTNGQITSQAIIVLMTGLSGYLGYKKMLAAHQQICDLEVGQYRKQFVP